MSTNEPYLTALTMVGVLGDYLDEVGVDPSALMTDAELATLETMVDALSEENAAKVVDIAKAQFREAVDALMAFDGKPPEVTK